MSSPPPTISSFAITALLQEKHKNDTFVAECNTGSAYRGCRRMDGWAMRHTWSPFSTVGYEIKTQRSDFLRDDKWPEYLGHCHQLYFVCPPGVISPSELPPEVGLIVTSKNAKRLYTKRKAARREIDPPWEVMAYALMWRGRDKPRGKDERVADIKAWLGAQKERKELGFLVGQAVRDVVENIKGENRRLWNDNERLAGVRDRITELGFDSDDSVTYWHIDNALGRLAGVISPRDVTDLRIAAKQLAKAADILSEGKNG